MQPQLPPQLPLIPPIPAPSELKLITMTITYSLGHFINLAVVFQYLKLTEEIICVKFENEHRGLLIEKKKRKKNKNTGKRRYFKNQCTLIIKHDGYVNVKLFNNGGIVMTGCRSRDQANYIVDIIINAIFNLDGQIEYDIPEKLLVDRGLSDFFSEIELRKAFKQEIYKYCNLIQLIALDLGWENEFNLEPFNRSYSIAHCFDLFKEEIKK